MQAPLAPKDTRGCFLPQSQWRWAWHSHGSVVGAAALQRLSVKQPRPTAPAATRGVQPTTTPPHYRPFLFCFIHVVCLFAPSPTPKISAHIHKREETKRKGGTISPFRRGPTLSSTHHHCCTGDRSHIAESTPQCAPHHRAVDNGRDAAMHRLAPFSHHSSVACPHKVANTIRVHTNPIIPSLAEAHYSHGVTTFGDTPAAAGCMEFPCQPRKETQQLCGVKVAAPRCCPQSTWQEESHARIVPDSSLFECPTEHVKKIPARKMELNA
ncbi:hypothetical protein TcCL_Unassigned03783 [Trypanosoma cruzi]|nr:hypothetical protein TcCL_Unassigned03783 [Trypanosoma cruzi]